MFSAQVEADSVSPDGVRLVTMVVSFPKWLLAQFNTHRAFCLAGDALLEFDLPAGTKRGRRVYRMRLDEFVDKWTNGARRFTGRKKAERDLSWVCSGHLYSVAEVAARLGMASTSNINTYCNRGTIEAERIGRAWRIRGQAIIDWRKSEVTNNRYDMRARLAAMQIRQLNEDTGDVQLSSITDARESGSKRVYEVTAGEFRMTGSADHRVLTASGWKPIGELTDEDHVIVRKFGKRDDDRMDPLRLRKIGGVWRSRWQAEMRAAMVAESPICRRCRRCNGVDIHHIVPVYLDPSRALDPSNITFLCDDCHAEMHRTQGWQGGTYLYGAAVQVDGVTYKGVQPTFDLTIAGRYPNFIANGVVVHNSRNAASSRAIPVHKRIAAVVAEPFIPESFGLNRPGMTAGGPLPEAEARRAKVEWENAIHVNVDFARRLADLGVHKEWAGRILEPYSWTTVVVTATDWANFFALRIHPDAQPEMQKVATLMRDAMAGSEPTKFEPDEVVPWHLPFVRDDDWDSWAACDLTTEDLKLVSVGRNARVSTLTHDGRRDPAADVALARRLIDARPPHSSPLEHVATPAPGRWANFRGWKSMRLDLPGNVVEG